MKGSQRFLLITQIRKYGSPICNLELTYFSRPLEREKLTSYCFKRSKVFYHIVVVQAEAQSVIWERSFLHDLNNRFFLFIARTYGESLSGSW